MERDVFDRETLLDLTVNVIPLGIILFFVVLFLVVAPWGYNPVDTSVQMALLVAPFAALAVLTYYSGKAIARDEKKLEADADVGATPELETETAPDPAVNEALEGEDADAPPTAVDAVASDAERAGDEPAENAAENTAEEDA